MASADSFYGKPNALYSAMSADCFDGVLRTRGGVAAGLREHRRDGAAVEFYREDEDMGEDVHLIFS